MLTTNFVVMGTWCAIGSSSATFDPPFFCQFACLTNNHGSFHDLNRSFDPNLKFGPSNKEQWGQSISQIMRWHPNICSMYPVYWQLVPSPPPPPQNDHHNHDRWVDTTHVCTHTLEDERGGAPTPQRQLGGLHTAVDPVVIINNATVIATHAYLTTCCNCNGDNLLGTTIAGVMIKMNAKNGDWTCNLSGNMVTWHIW